MDNQQLENRIQALEKWKTERTRQQITFPLDTTSQQVLANYFMQITASVVSAGGAGGKQFLQFIGNQGIYSFSVTQNTYVPYTVNVSSNVITVNASLTSTGNVFEDDTELYVAFTLNGVPPSPLTEGTPYYVINSSGTTFKLSTTVGGAEINITDTGTGNQYLYYF